MLARPRAAAGGVQPVNDPFEQGHGCSRSRPKLPWPQGFTWVAKIPISDSAGRNRWDVATGFPDGLRRNEPMQGRRCGASGEDERIPRTSR
jgi:hypothetical protein